MYRPSCTRQCMDIKCCDENNKNYAIFLLFFSFLFFSLNPVHCCVWNMFCCVCIHFWFQIRNPSNENALYLLQNSVPQLLQNTNGFSIQFLFGLLNVWMQCMKWLKSTEFWDSFIERRKNKKIHYLKLQ